MLRFLLLAASAALLLADPVSVSARFSSHHRQSVSSSNRENLDRLISELEDIQVELRQLRSEGDFRRENHRQRRFEPESSENENVADSDFSADVSADVAKLFGPTISDKDAYVEAVKEYQQARLSGIATSQELHDLKNNQDEWKKVVNEGGLLHSLFGGGSKPSRRLATQTRAELAFAGLASRLPPPVLFPPPSGRKHKKNGSPPPPPPPPQPTPPPVDPTLDPTADPAGGAGGAGGPPGGDPTVQASPNMADDPTADPSADDPTADPSASGN